MHVPEAGLPARLPPTHPLSRELFDDAALWAWEQQLRLDDLLGGDSPYGKGPWWVDPQAGTITFNHGRQPALAATAHFLGSASPAAGVWSWAWADPNGLPAPMTDAAAQLRVHAESYEHHGLHTPTTELAEEAAGVAWRIGSYASYVLDLPCYLFDGGGGAIGALLVEHAMLALREPNALRTVQAVNRALDSGLVSDWPRALTSYARKRGLGLEPVGAGYALRLPKGAPVLVELDSAGRVGLVHSHTS